MGIEKSDLLNFLKEECIEHGEFTLTHGDTLPTYVKVKKLLTRPHYLYWAGVYLWEVMELGSNTIAALELGAVPVATTLGQIIYQKTGLVRPTIFIRKQPKSYGAKELFLDSFPPGARVAIVEDVIDTGGSVLKLYDTLQKHNIEVNQIISIVDRCHHSQEYIQFQQQHTHDIHFGSVFSENDLFG